MGKMPPWESLLALMDRLRDPGGCPWDREQTMSDLKVYLLEEAYEVVDAIDSKAPEALREELGDLIFQIVFLSRIAKEKGEFTVDDVLRDITDKMVRRHPHVFGQASAGTAREVLRQWEEIKRAERAEEEPSTLDGVRRSLPALLRAQRLTTKAARVGFDWPGPEEVLAKVEEEISELRGAISAEPTQKLSEKVSEELGDILFAVSNLARHLGVDPETALQRTNSKFIRRFRRMEELLRERRTTPGEVSLAELDLLWERAKLEERQEEPLGSDSPGRPVPTEGP